MSLEDPEDDELAHRTDAPLARVEEPEVEGTLVGEVAVLEVL
jgi:hypothetical protein